MDGCSELSQEGNHKMVSIIIPVFQVADYIERCLNSVFDQTYSDIECIIVDDATKDDSIERCEKLIDEYNGSISFKILHHERNRGLSAARNTGIRAATGKYLFYLDGDDEITSSCIEELLAIAEANSEAEMVVGNHKEIDSEGRERLYISLSVPSGLITSDIIADYYQKRLLPRSAWNKLMRRSFVMQHQLLFKEGILFEDTLWTFYMLKVVSKVYVHSRATYLYYSRPNSIVTGTNTYSEGKNFVVIYEEILRNLSPGGECVELNRYVEGFCERYIRCRNGIPAYRTLMRDYKKLSLKYGCRNAYMKLVSSYLLDKVPHGLSILHQLYAIKTKVSFA